MPRLADSAPAAPAESTPASGNTNSSNPRTPATYGYHNTFHTHAQPALDASPPTYACANSRQTRARLNDIARAENAGTALPGYTCGVEITGLLGLKQELVSPFQVSSNREWDDYFVVLRGTQLSIHRPKNPGLLSKNKTVGPGRLLRTYTLQHAEVGVAADFKKTSLTPKSPFAHLVPAASRQKLFETDPHLFEPVREHVLRLRLETEQFLLCAPSQEQMLDWTESLCAAIDISLPLEDRSEPRYRSLPRRSRRQRQLDGSRVGPNLDNLSSIEGGRRLIAEQERIFRQLYPHLAATSNTERIQEHAAVTTSAAVDLESDDLDPDDARFPSARRTTSRGGESDDRPSSSATSDSSADPKSRAPHQHTPAQALRYRRRCAPVLLASSPRVSDVVYSGGERMRINVKDHILVEYTAHPPRYDAHHFAKPSAPLQPVTEEAVVVVATNTNTITKAKPAPPPAVATAIASNHHLLQQRPASPLRGISNDSFMSFGYDTPADEYAGGNPMDDLDSGDAIRSASSSEPPSPTTATASQAKSDAARRLVTLGKTRTSEETARENGLSAVALGVGLLI